MSWTGRGASDRNDCSSCSKTCHVGCPGPLGMSCTKRSMATRCSHESYGAQEPRPNGGCHALRLSHRHAQCGTRKKIEPPDGPGTQPGNAAGPNPPRNEWGRKRTRVQQDERTESLGSSHGRTQTDRASPVVRHERDILQRQPIQQCHQIGNMLPQCVRVILRLVTQTAADMIDRHNPIVLAKVRDQAPPIEGPGRVPVHHHHWPSRAFIDVVHVHVAERHVVRIKRIQGAPCVVNSHGRSIRHSSPRV